MKTIKMIMRYNNTEYLQALNTCKKLHAADVHIALYFFDQLLYRWNPIHRQTKLTYNV